jgi:hypothetical protein
VKEDIAMSDKTTKSTRRVFFARGGAALGAGVAATVGASALASEKSDPLEQQLEMLRREVVGAHERAVIRQLHLDFAALIEQQAYDNAAQLFDEQADLDLSGASARGKTGIHQLFAQRYGNQTAAVIHGAYRQNASQQSADALRLSDDGQQAAATFHVDVQLCTPLREDCTAAKMARLQGQFADRRWETGRLEGQYVKRAGEWKIASLKYRTA